MSEADDLIVRLYPNSPDEEERLEGIWKTFNLAHPRMHFLHSKRVRKAVEGRDRSFFTKPLRLCFFPDLEDEADIQERFRQASSSKSGKKHNIKGSAYSYSIITEDLQSLPKADTVFLLKVLESLEAIKRDITLTILKELKCKRIIISFAKIALGKNKKIKKSGRSWLRKMLKQLNYRYRVEDIDQEIFFFIDKE